MRSRKWFITINPQANCYTNIMTILDEVRPDVYIMVVHDKEEEKEDYGDEQPKHYHLCIKFKNARSFESMLKKFQGAHVEVCEYWNRSVQYLCHLNHPHKLQYEYDDLISNIERDEVMSYLMLDEYEKLNTENLLIAIQEGLVKDLFDAVQIWGVHQVASKYNLIEKLINLWKEKH